MKKKWKIMGRVSSTWGKGIVFRFSVKSNWKEKTPLKELDVVNDPLKNQFLTL